MSKETKKLDNWFNDHFEISFVGAETKETKKLKKKIVKDLKKDLLKNDSK